MTDRKRAAQRTWAKFTKGSLLDGTALWLIAITLAANASAQDASSTTPATPLAPTATAPAPEAIEEVIVTAQRHEQNVEHIGIAVTPISGNTLNQTGVAITEDIVPLVPSLKYNTFSNTATVFNLRGVSQNDFGDQEEPPVAVYKDDSYASSLNLTSFPEFDIARVEVLRGPQGTLFGRNATGGVIHFISNQPSDPDRYLRVTTGRFGALVIEGAGSVQLSDTLAVRVSGQRSTGGNYLKAIEPGFHDTGGYHNYALRGIADWNPISNFSAQVTMRYLNGDHEPQSSQSSHEVSCPNAQGQGVYLQPNVTCPAFDGNGLAGPGTLATGFRDDAINPVRGGNPFRIAETAPSFVNREIIGGTLRLEGQIGDVDLISITDYVHATKFYEEDSDGSPDPNASFRSTSHLNQVTQEVRLSGQTERNYWLVGAFGMILNGHYSGSFNIPYVDFFPFTVFRQRTNSYAIFGHDEFAITPKLKLISGLRFWHDERIGTFNGQEASTGVKVSFSKSGLSYLQDGVPQSLAGSGLTVGANNSDTSYSGLNASAEIDYTPIPDLLLYVSYNRGGKSGGFGFATVTPGPGASSVSNYLNGIPYRPETLNSYEGGIKTTLLPRTTLNIDGFWYNYQNYQAFIQFGQVQTIKNLPANELGLEVEADTHFYPGLTISANASFLDSNVKNVVLQDGEFAKHDLPQAPAFSGTALARYEFDLGPGVASVQGEYQYSTRFNFSVLSAPTDRERHHSVTNARIGYNYDRFDLAFFVNNIFNEEYRVFAGDNSFGGFEFSIFARPRTWGLTGTVHL